MKKIIKFVFVKILESLGKFYFWLSFMKKKNLLTRTIMISETILEVEDQLIFFYIKNVYRHIN